MRRLLSATNIKTDTAKNSTEGISRGFRKVINAQPNVGMNSRTSRGLRFDDANAGAISTMPTSVNSAYHDVPVPHHQPVSIARFAK